MHYFAVNGQPNKDISITSRGLNYGDGVFTTAKISQGKVEFLAEHMQRLVTSCETLAIHFSQHQEVLQQVIELAKTHQNAVVKIVVCAGQGGRGYSRTGVAGCDVILSIHDVPAHYEQWQEQGISLGNSSIQLGINPLLNGLKHLNRLEQVLIKNELDQRREDDVLVCNINNQVIESSSANLFWQKEGQLFTPDLVESGIFGLARQQLLLLFPDTQIVKADLGDLQQVSAMFICNSVMGIVPVKSYLGRALDTSAFNAIQQRYRIAREASCGSF